MAYLLAPETTVEHFTRTQKMIFIAFFPINFSSTALFKNAFLGFDLAGRPFGDFEQLSPCKMRKNMVPIARLASGQELFYSAFLSLSSSSTHKYFFCNRTGLIDDRSTNIATELQRI